MKLRGAAVVLLVTALLLGGCSMENERLRATDREDDIDAVAAELYTAVGVEPDDRVLYAYERSTNQGCAVTLDVEEGFGEGEAWYGRKAYDIRRGGPDDDPQLLADAASHLRERGWQVQEFVSGPRLRLMNAVKGDVAIRVSSPPFSFAVTAGPCATELTGVSDRFTPAPPGPG